MSQETFGPPPEIDPQTLGWVPGNRGPEYEIPPEAYLEQARYDYAEVQSRLATLRSIFEESQQLGYRIPPHLTERYERLVARRLKLEQQLGLGPQLNIFPAADRTIGRGV